jgi:hypothetical protein
LDQKTTPPAAYFAPEAASTRGRAATRSGSERTTESPAGRMLKRTLSEHAYTVVPAS